VSRYSVIQNHEIEHDFVAKDSQTSFGSWKDILLSMELNQQSTKTRPLTVTKKVTRKFFSSYVTYCWTSRRKTDP